MDPGGRVLPPPVPGDPDSLRARGEDMPDSYGKRQRNAHKARKFAAREERRVARKQQRADRAAGVHEGQAPDESPEGEVDGVLEGELDVSEAGSGDQTESHDDT
jgi:hypothetical protein